MTKGKMERQWLKQRCKLTTPRNKSKDASRRLTAEGQRNVVRILATWEMKAKIVGRVSSLAKMAWAKKRVRRKRGKEVRKGPRTKKKDKKAGKQCA